MNKNKTKVLILCSGEGSRWNNYLGAPKHLIIINGESLLKRMIRLIRCHGYDDIDIVAQDKRLKIDGCGFYTPTDCSWTVETLLSTRPIWKDKTIVLLGDVFFSQRAIKKIVNTKPGIRVFGRPRESWYTYTKYGEIFALSFTRDYFPEVVKHASIARDFALKGGKGKFWQLYRSLAGFRQDEYRVEKRYFVPIHDLTDDIDDREEYHRIIDRYTAATSKRFFVRSRLFLWLKMIAVYNVVRNCAVNVKRLLFVFSDQVIKLKIRENRFMLKKFLRK